MAHFLMSTRIHMGQSSLEEIKGLGMKRAYIICDPFMKKCGRAEELASILHEAGTETEIFSDVVPDPSIEVVTAAIQGMKKFGPDGIVALGGGSAIDTAKAAGQLYGAMNGGARPMLAAVPTTSGTGSEVTSFAVISDTQAQVKYALRDQAMVPDAAFLDPALTASVPPAEIRNRVDKALKQVDMYAYREHSPHLLSGGQKQRIAIAGVIAMEPRCIVLDEPTAMLDPRGRKEVMDTIARLNQEKNITVILITHHMDEAARCQRVVVLNQGAVAADGTPQEVFSQVELLHSIGLAAPDTVELCWALNQQGFQLPLDQLEPEDCARAIFQAITG